MKILATGVYLSLVGSRITEVLKDKYEFDSSTEDITDKNLIQNRIRQSDAEIVLHLAAKTNVDGCEEDKSLGENGTAWKVNVNGTENIAQACLETNKKLIYISTDFVFDGQKEGGYVEEDIPNPVNWYGQTKYEGEKKVQSICKNHIIARIAYPYRVSGERVDFARGLIGKIRDSEFLPMIIDHVMTPTFIDDIANALDALLSKNQTGIFHVVGSQSVSPYEAALLICDIFGFEKSKIGKTTRQEFFKGRAPRGFKLILKNDKIKRLGINMKTFEEGLEEIKNQ